MSTRRIVAALVRHGDYHQPDRVPSAQLPHPLTAKGIEQARTLAAQLRDECRELDLQLDPVIDCSTLLRARQTADLAVATLTQLAAAVGAGVTPRPLAAGSLTRHDFAGRFLVAEFAELGERSVGAAANLTVDAIASALALDARYPELPAGWKAHPRFRLPVAGAESLLMAGARVAAHIEGRAHELRSVVGHDVLKVFISHGGALRHAAVCMGALDLSKVPSLSLHHCGYVFVEYLADPDGGPGRWQQVGGRWKPRSSAID